MARPERIYKDTEDWYYRNRNFRSDDARFSADFKKGFCSALEMSRLQCRGRDRKIEDLSVKVKFLEAALAVESAKHAALIEAFTALSGERR